MDGRRRPMDSLVRKALTVAREHSFASPPGMELSDFASESVIVSDERGVILLFIRHDIDSKSIALSTEFGSGLPRVMATGFSCSK
jgi:hypothetical protein